MAESIHESDVRETGPETEEEELPGSMVIARDDAEGFATELGYYLSKGYIVIHINTAIRLENFDRLFAVLIAPRYRDQTPNLSPPSINMHRELMDLHRDSMREIMQLTESSVP